MTYKNGDAEITHCDLCNAEFEEAQKFGDIIPCDNCGQTYQLNIKR